MGLTTAVTPVVLTVLVATVITLTDPVLVDVNQDTTLTRASFAIKVSKNDLMNLLRKHHNLIFMNSLNK